jgi:hypothetical protein
MAACLPLQAAHAGFTIYFRVQPWWTERIKGSAETLLLSSGALAFLLCLLFSFFLFHTLRRFFLVFLLAIHTLAHDSRLLLNPDFSNAKPGPLRSCKYLAIRKPFSGLENHPPLTHPNQQTLVVSSARSGHLPALPGAGNNSYSFSPTRIFLASPECAV